VRFGGFCLFSTMRCRGWCGGDGEMEKCQVCCSTPWIFDSIECDDVEVSIVGAMGQSSSSTIALLKAQIPNKAHSHCESSHGLVAMELAPAPSIKSTKKNSFFFENPSQAQARSILNAHSTPILAIKSKARAKAAQRKFHRKMSANTTQHFLSPHSRP